MPFCLKKINQLRNLGISDCGHLVSNASVVSIILFSEATPSVCLSVCLCVPHLLLHRLLNQHHIFREYTSKDCAYTDIDFIKS